MPDAQAARKRVPVREGFFDSLDQPLENVHLVGSRCRSCRYVFFGRRTGCENCGSEALEDITLSRRGVIWSYTVQRYHPPGDYKGPEPFQPFAVAAVELPEEVRVLAPLTGIDVDRVKVGMNVELVVEPLYQDANGNEVIAYKFRPVEGRRTR
ncbi:MAG: Zn-ribbon domain-containing OB-fold protein [Chloroflexi bacterium]|nr:Zn-ribbon domain-containing OB-fold protein [Chloroflexota bacterium]